MTKKTLLICSALLAAPFCGLSANDAEPVSSNTHPIAKTEMYQKAIDDLNLAFALPMAIKRVDQENVSDFVSANPMVELSVLRAKPNVLLARLKDKVEPGVSETRMHEAEKPAAISNPSDGRVHQSNRTRITNS